MILFHHLYGSYGVHDNISIEANVTTPNTTTYYSTTSFQLPVIVEKYVECGDIIDSTITRNAGPHYAAFDNIYIDNRIIFIW